MLKLPQLVLALVSTTAVVAALGVAVFLTGAGPFGSDHGSARASQATFADQESAIQQTLNCMSAAGLKVSSIPAERLRPTQNGFQISSIDQADAAQKIVDDCKNKTGLADIEIARALAPKTDAQMNDVVSRLRAA